MDWLRRKGPIKTLNPTIVYHSIMLYMNIYIYIYWYVLVYYGIPIPCFLTKLEHEEMSAPPLIEHPFFRSWVLSEGIRRLSKLGAIMM